jgi:hypothetical protein
MPGFLAVATLQMMFDGDSYYYYYYYYIIIIILYGKETCIYTYKRPHGMVLNSYVQR